MSTPVIEATGLGVTLGGQPILDGIDLAVPAGEVLALLGANGSGKSTLVRALLGVVPAPPATSGCSAPRWARRPRGTASGTCRSGCPPPRASRRPPTRWSRPACCTAARCARRAGTSAARSTRSADVGLADRAYQRVQEMSGGQQQRVLIARALVRDPDLLVLDEPTSGIDIPTQATFVDTVSRLHDAGTTVVVILHELGPFAPLIDRAVVLRHGRVAHDGAPPRARGEHAGEWHDHTHAHPDPEPPRTGPSLSVEVNP